MTHSDQCVIENFLSEDAREQLPDDIREAVSDLILSLSKKIVSLYRSKDRFAKRCNKFKKRCQEYGIWESKYNDRNVECEQAILKRLRHIEDYVQYMDDSVGACVDLATKYTMRLIDKNGNVNDTLQEHFQKHFVKEKNALTKELDNDHEYAARVFFNGFINGWTNSDYEVFNKVV